MLRNSTGNEATVAVGKRNRTPRGAFSCGSPKREEATTRTEHNTKAGSRPPCRRYVRELLLRPLRFSTVFQRVLAAEPDPSWRTRRGIFPLRDTTHHKIQVGRGAPCKRTSAALPYRVCSRFEKSFFCDPILKCPWNQPTNRAVRLRLCAGHAGSTYAADCHVGGVDFHRPSCTADPHGGLDVLLPVGLGCPVALTPTHPCIASFHRSQVVRYVVWCRSGWVVSAAAKYRAW